MNIVYGVWKPSPRKERLVLGSEQMRLELSFGKSEATGENNGWRSASYCFA